MTPDPDRAPSPAPTSLPADEMDLRQLVRAVWHHRWVVVVLGVAGGLLGAWYSYSRTHYLAEGLLLTPQLEVSAYKQYEAALDNEPRLEAFIRLNGLEDTPTAGLLRGLMQQPGALEKAVRPAFSITSREAKVYDVQLAPEKAGELFGIQLVLARRQKNDDSPIRSLAEYVRDTIIEVDMRAGILEQCLAFRTREQELRNEQLRSDFTVQQARARATQLRKLISEVPGAAEVDNRQVVSVENGGERFLSPTAQLVAVELQIGDAELADAVRERERVAAVLKRDYYCAALEMHQQPHTGKDLFDQLAAIQARTFAGKDLAQPIIEQTANELELQRSGWTSKYFARTRFVVSPDGGERRVRDPGLVLGGLAGGVLGGLLGLLMALVLAWWHDNRDVVLAPEDR